MLLFQSVAIYKGVIMNVKIAHWQAFVLVVDLGSFSAAAKHMKISVSTVSKSISRLEEMNNVILLDRDTHSVMLTDAGNIAYAKAVQLIELADELTNSLQNPSYDINGSIRFTAPALICEFLANFWVKEYIDKHKNVSVFLESRESSQFSKETSVFDHLVFRSGVIDSEDLVHRQLSPLQLSLCASRQYLSEYGDITHPSELHNHNFLWVHDVGLPGILTFNSGNEEYVFEKSDNHRYSSDNLLGAFNLMSMDKGITIATPGFLAQNSKQFPHVTTILDNWKIMPIPIYLIWRQRRFYSPLFRDFIEFISHKWDGRQVISVINKS